jgi:hypothetical protein
MNTNWTRGLSLVGLLLASAATTQANDIVDFLKTINGNSGRRSAPVAVRPVGGHGHELHQAGYGRGQGSGHLGYHRHPANSVNLRPNQYIAPPVRSGLQVNLRLASNGQPGIGYGPPVYIPAHSPLQVLPPVSAYPPVAPSPFQLGQFVNCPVPLATCVRVEDECNIAPNAVPVIIAVRDPHACVHDVGERLVFVQIFVPPCRLRNLQMSPCGTRISLDYGRHDVEIRSGNGLVLVDYDN